MDCGQDLVRLGQDLGGKGLGDLVPVKEKVFIRAPDPHPNEEFKGGFGGRKIRLLQEGFGFCVVRGFGTEQRELLDEPDDLLSFRGRRRPLPGPDPGQPAAGFLELPGQFRFPFYLNGDFLDLLFLPRFEKVPFGLEI